MFVDITDFKGAIEVENMLRAYKRGEMKITPEVCLEVLAATNYKRNIRDMLECVAKLPVAEQAGFKDVVLSTFDNREQPNDVLVLGKKLAVAGGYEAELGEIAGVIQEGDYLKSEIHAEKWCVTAREDWSGENLLAYHRMKFIREKANLCDAKNLPEILDVSGCCEVSLNQCDLAGIRELRFKDGAAVYLCKARGLPKDFDMSMCDEVNLHKCDLASVKNLRFKAGAKVYLYEAKNLPEDLDVSMCDVVDLGKCDLVSVKNLRFKAEAKVYLYEAKNLPEDLDVSMCNYVNLRDCFLGRIKNLRFKARAEVNLRRAMSLPKDLDVSMCNDVDLQYCNLASVKNLRFKEGARVYMRQAKYLPENLDVSMCDEVNLAECDLSMVKSLRFKDKEQMAASYAALPSNWGGKIAFAEEEKTPGKFSTAEIAAAKAKEGR